MNRAISFQFLSFNSLSNFAMKKLANKQIIVAKFGILLYYKAY